MIGLCYNGSAYDTVYILKNAWMNTDPADFKASPTTSRRIPTAASTAPLTSTMSTRRHCIIRCRQMTSTRAWRSYTSRCRTDSTRSSSPTRWRRTSSEPFLGPERYGRRRWTGNDNRIPVPALFACEDIHIRLGGRPILEGISLGIRPGEILGVVGPNGAGKTTLFEVLSGRYKPDHGRVLLGGRDITSMRLFARARIGLGRTYQSPVVPDALTVARCFAPPGRPTCPISPAFMPNGRPRGRLAGSDGDARRLPRYAEPA